MSIIYDALKKIESNDGSRQDKDKPKKTKRYNAKIALIFYASFIVLLVVLVQFLSRRSSEVVRVNEPPPESAVKDVPVPARPKTAKVSAVGGQELLFSAKSLPALSISGIIFSNGQHYALINGKMLKAGDIIEGIKIQDIDAEGVVVEFRDSSLRLEYP